MHNYIRQTEYKVIMTKEVSIKVIYFMTPGAGVLVLGLAIFCIISLKSTSLPPGMDQTKLVHCIWY